MNVREVATWLANVDSNGCTDEEFAGVFVLMYKMWKNNDPEAKVTKDDMWEFDESEFSDWIHETLWEIIESEETNQSAWWKKED